MWRRRSPRRRRSKRATKPRPWRRRRAETAVTAAVALLFLLLVVWWFARPSRPRQRRRRRPSRCHDFGAQQRLSFADGRDDIGPSEVDATCRLLSRIFIGVVTCSSCVPGECDAPARHAALVAAAGETWLRDAAHCGARVLFASDAPLIQSSSPAASTTTATNSSPPPLALDAVHFCNPRPAGTASSKRPASTAAAGAAAAGAAAAAPMIAYARHAPRTARVLRPESARTLRMLAHAYDTHGDTVDWYIKCDDDAYIRMERLAPLLAQMNATRALYLGSVRRFTGTLVALADHHDSDSHGGGGGGDVQVHHMLYAMGGAGYMVSRALLAALRPRLASGECPPYNGEDKSVALCIWNTLRIRPINLPGMHYGPPESVIEQQRDATVAFHHLERAVDVRRTHARFRWWRARSGDGHQDYAAAGRGDAARAAEQCVRIDSGGDAVP